MSSIFENREGLTGTEWVKENAPQIAFWAGNILLVAGEWRVYDYVYNATGQAWKAVFAVLATFVPFLLWEFGAQHKKNTGGMVACAVVGMVISLGLGVVIGVADYIAVDGQAINGQAILTALALGLSAQAMLMLAYFYQHPDMVLAYVKARARGQEEIREERAREAREMLAQARENMLLERALVKEFGEEDTRRALDRLQGRRSPERESTRKPQPPATNAPMPQMAHDVSGSVLSNPVNPTAGGGKR